MASGSEQAIYDRQPEPDELTHHSARGPGLRLTGCGIRSKYSEIDPSGGSRDDSYDNVPAEAINGLYKAALADRRKAWKAKESLEFENCSGCIDLTTNTYSNPSILFLQQMQK
jgi:hypothetical protein